MGYEGNMVYKVIISELAESQLDHIVYYILYELNNLQAGISILEDAEETKQRLSHVAGSLRLCDHPRLHELGYRMIHFKHHQYIMVYRIQGHKVYVEGIYHDLQDYENILR